MWPAVILVPWLMRTQVCHPTSVSNPPTAPRCPVPIHLQRPGPSHTWRPRRLWSQPPATPFGQHIPMTCQLRPVVPWLRARHSPDGNTNSIPKWRDEHAARQLSRHLQHPSDPRAEGGPQRPRLSVSAGRPQQAQERQARVQSIQQSPCQTEQAADHAAGMPPSRTLTEPSLSYACAQGSQDLGEGAAIHVLDPEPAPRPAILGAWHPAGNAFCSSRAHHARRPSPLPRPHGLHTAWAAAQTALDTHTHPELPRGETAQPSLPQESQVHAADPQAQDREGSRPTHVRGPES